MIKNKLIFGLVLLFSLSTLCFADSEESLLIKGLQAYKDKDWTTSLFFLRKAATLPVNNNAETWYVLIMAEVYASDFEGVLTDGSYFIYRFKDSSYVPQIKYQMARATFLLEDYNQAFGMFNDFCNEYPKHELYSSSLFWKAECLYQLYDYVESEKLFKNLLTEYPDSPKCVEAAFRIELLEQREREEKLLYLLRVTGEENLAAREDYERQIKMYQSEESINFKMKVTELTLLVEALQQELEDSNTRIENLLNKVNELSLLNEELKLASEDAKKSAAIAEYEAELQKKNYEEQLQQERNLLEAQKLAQKEAENSSNLENKVEDLQKTESPVEEDLEANVSFDEEITYIPNAEEENKNLLPEVDIELQKLKDKAKELEDLLKK